MKILNFDSAIATVSAGTASVPSISFAGDPNTGIYSPGADQLAISTGGSERLRITSAGLVGIGTSAPGALLHLRTSAPCAILETTRNFTVNRNFEFAVDQYAEGVFTVTPSTALGGTTFTTPALAVTGTGRVGIGTTSPSNTFHVSSSSGTPALIASSTFFNVLKFTSSTNTAGCSFGIDGSSNATVENGDATKGITFITGTTERVRIDSSGRLLVGTSSARSNFFNTSTVTAGIQAESTGEGSIVAAIRNVNDATTVPVYLLAKSRGTSVGSNTIVQSQDHLGYLSFQGSDGSEFVEAARISGEVDGTPGANDMPGRLVFSTTADGAASPTERLRIQSDGNILIGVTSGATGLLSVGPVANKTGIFGSASTAGSPGIQGAHTVNSATGYVAYFANSGSATGLYISNTAAWQSTSDVRLKTDIQDLDAVSRLMQIKPKSYLWKSQATSDEPTKRNFGFIAQEVQEVFPELVGESPDGMLSVEYTGLIAPLVNTIQFLKAEIDALKAEVAALKAQ